VTARPATLSAGAPVIPEPGRVAPGQVPPVPPASILRLISVLRWILGTGIPVINRMTEINRDNFHIAEYATPVMGRMRHPGPVSSRPGHAGAPRRWLPSLAGIALPGGYVAAAAYPEESVESGIHWSRPEMAEAKEACESAGIARTHLRLLNGRHHEVQASVQPPQPGQDPAQQLVIRRRPLRQVGRQERI